MDGLLELVESCDIKSRRSKQPYNIKQARYLGKKLEELEEKPIIQKYISRIEKLDYLNNHFNKKKIKEIKRIRAEVERLEGHFLVARYRFLWEQYYLICDYIKKYYISLNVILRKELLNYNLPEIYVYQGKIDDELEIFRHIVVPNTVKTVLDQDDIAIYPEEEIHSIKGYRRFYNRVSFRYLEGLSKDYSYDLEEKKLTKVRIVYNKKNN